MVACPKTEELVLVAKESSVVPPFAVEVLGKSS